MDDNEERTRQEVLSERRNDLIASNLTFETPIKTFQKALEALKSARRVRLNDVVHLLSKLTSTQKDSDVELNNLVKLASEVLLRVNGEVSNLCSACGGMKKKRGSMRRGKKRSSSRKRGCGRRGSKRRSSHRRSMRSCSKSRGHRSSSKRGCGGKRMRRASSPTVVVDA